MSSVINPAISGACAACGQPMPGGAALCPSCGQVVTARHGRVTLLVVFALILCGFAFTQYLVKLHHRTEDLLAQRWFTRGEAAMQTGNASAAADDYRTALSYDRENDLYRLRLSQALLASNRLNEAGAHLLSLWDEEPADGEVNLALAHLYVRRNAPTQSVGYYRNAINGVWDNEPQQHRIAIRFELVQYLLKLDDTARASAELLALQADQPPAIPDQLLLANLLLEVGEDTRAIDVYNKLLKDDSGNAQALLGLGEASFKIGDYLAAERALAAAAVRDPNSTETVQQLNLAREVLRIAPGLRGLSLSERTRRVAEAFNAATSRLNSCASQKGYSFNPPSNATPAFVTGNNPSANSSQKSPVPGFASTGSAPDDLQLLYNRVLELKPTATERALREKPDSLEPVIQFVFDVERSTAPVCPDMGKTDQALLVLARHESETVR